MMIDNNFIKTSIIAGKKIYTHNGISYSKLRKSKYKYILTKDINILTSINNVSSPYINIRNCNMTISKNYKWDGASGPCFDTKKILKASLVHDALYQLIREGLLEKSKRKYADSKFYTIMRECGVRRFRARYCYLAVRLFGWASCNKEKIFIYLLKKLFGL